MICKAAALTKQIRMGPGIRPVPFFHPLQLATDAAVCDHLTNGRYIAGFGVGINVANNKQRGPLPADTTAIPRRPGQAAAALANKGTIRERLGIAGTPVDRVDRGSTESI